MPTFGWVKTAVGIRSGSKPALAVAEQPVDDHHRLRQRHRRQLRPVGDVADGMDRRQVAAPGLVDHDRAVRPQFDPDLGQPRPCVFGPRPVAISTHVGQRERAAVVEVDAQPGARCARIATGLRPKRRRTPFFCISTRKEAADIGVEAAQQPLRRGSVASPRRRGRGRSTPSRRRYSRRRPRPAGAEIRAGRTSGRRRPRVRSRESPRSVGWPPVATRIWAARPCRARTAFQRRHGTSLARLDDRTAAQQRDARAVEQPLVDAIQPRDLAARRGFSRAQSKLDCSPAQPNPGASAKPSP